MTEDSLREVAGRFELTKVGVRPRFGTYLADAWRQRAFARTLARYRIESENERTRLGLLWVVVKPLLNALVYGVVFGLILPSDTRPENFVAFLIVGVFIFEYFNASFSEGAKAVTSNARLVQSLSFPRILLPIAVLLEQTYRLLPMLAVMFILILILGEPIAWSWLLLVPVLLLMALFNAGVAMIGARLSVHLRDFLQVIPFVSRIVFYTSSIFFSIDLVFADRPELLAVAHLNPVYEFIALSRDVLITGSPAEPTLWVWGAIWSVVLFIFGVVYFWSAEERYGRE